MPHDPYDLDEILAAAFFDLNPNVLPMTLAPPDGGLVTGTEGADRIVGQAGDDIISTLGGNDIASPGRGNDTIDGGEGTDWISLIPAINEDDLEDRGTGGAYGGTYTGATLDLRETGPQDLGGLGIDTILNFENIAGSHGNDILIGDDGDNVIDGDTGFDVLFGMGGNDIFVQFGALARDRGEDAFDLASYRDVMDGGDGIDTFIARSLFGGDYYDLSKNHDPNSSHGLARIENIILLGGYESPNYLIGNSANNLLYIDYIDSGSTITGGGGADIMYGAATYMYRSWRDSTVEHSGRDKIMTLGVIDLSAIDAMTGRGNAGDQAFFLGGSKFTKSAGEIIQIAEDGGIGVYADRNGDGRADFSIWVKSDVPLGSEYFVL